MAGTKISLAVVMAVLGLLAIVQPSMQRSLKSPLHLLPRHVRSENSSSTIGLVSNSALVEKALNDTGLFNVTSYVDLFGRRFMVGKIYSISVIYVRTLTTPSVHAGITVQIMADYFELDGIVHLGSAGAINQSLVIGTVSVPSYVGFLGALDWLSEKSNEKGELVFEDFNHPKKVENLLGSVNYEKIDIIYDGVNYPNYWIYASSSYLGYASKIVSEDVIVGLNASSADIYLKNYAYGEFLYNKFNVSTVETSAGGIGLGAKSNTLRFISFQGISNIVGGKSSTSKDRKLAAKNVAKAVVDFLWQASAASLRQDE